MDSFINDTQLPPLLAHVIQRLGNEAMHTSFYPDGQFLDDKTIREISITENRIIITKDLDFAEYFIVKGAPPRIILLALGNIKNKLLVDYFTDNWLAIKQLFAENYNLLILQKDSIIAY
jgi:predicted nuclease of predicted toxin-antitoxin system